MSTQSVHKTDCLMSSNLVLKAWRILRGHGSSVHVGRLKELSPDGSEDNADALTSKEESGQARTQHFPQISLHLSDSQKALPHCAPSSVTPSPGSPPIASP